MMQEVYDCTQLPDLNIATLQQAYQNGLTPSILVEYLLQRLAEVAQQQPDSHIWIHQLSAEWLRSYAQRLQQKSPDHLPLYGIPFAIKDNIDLASIPTTAACPAFAYTPETSAVVVQKLLDAGAIPIGKTNLDQFATGLNGTRSPYGVVRNSIDAGYISGGSSSGSAVAVAKQLVSFSLGTDTAGSGRVPAAFNNITGWKPSCGLLSIRGLVPACRSLDCISVFTQHCSDAQVVLQVVQGYDAADPFSKATPLAPVKPVKRIGIPQAKDLNFFGDQAYAMLYAQAIEKLKAAGFGLVEVDFAPFLAAANLLYSGPWVAERYHVVKELLTQPSTLLPVIETITQGATAYTAEDCFAAFYKLAAYKRQTESVWQTVDVMLTPTAGTIFSINDMLANPIELNTQLGYYTNFMNLLDFAAIAIPAGRRPDGLPFGVTFFAPAMQDLTLLALGTQVEQFLNL